MRDVVIQPTKSGFLFVLDRDTGKPVWPVEERPVPQGGVRRRAAFADPAVSDPCAGAGAAEIFRRRYLQAVPDAWPVRLREGRSRPLRNEGLFTPPSTQGTLIYPMTGGGVNWGSAAFDPVNQILYVNTSRAIHIVKLIPRAEAEGLQAVEGRGVRDRSAARPLR